MDGSCLQWPVPELHMDSEDKEPKEAEEPIKPGDCIFTIGLVPAPLEIQATSSVFQCLAKAFKCNSEASVPSGRSFQSICVTICNQTHVEHVVYIHF